MAQQTPPFRNELSNQEIRNHQTMHDSMFQRQLTMEQAVLEYSGEFSALLNSIQDNKDILNQKENNETRNTFTPPK